MFLHANKSFHITMTFHSRFCRSFGQNSIKKLACALLLWFIIPFKFRNIFNKPLYHFTRRVETFKRIHKTSNIRADVMEIDGDVIIYGNSSTINIASSSPSTSETDPTSSWTIKPYARKKDTFVMDYVTKWKIAINDRNPNNCVRNFTVPAILFSTGGYTGNQFHEFTDVLIPLYLTSRPFDRQVIFLVTDKRPPFITKYRSFLQSLSDHDIIDIDRSKDALCFPKMIVGLTAHVADFTIDESKPPYYTIRDFRQFLRETYSLNRKKALLDGNNKTMLKPRMLIISRRNSRLLKNEGQVAKMAGNMGFEVIVQEISDNMIEVARFVNSFDMIVGVHGAGLTNMVFLPDDAVVIEIVPFGLEHSAYFRSPARDMKLVYLEYKVNLNESSLYGKYPPDSDVYMKPGEIQKKGFRGFRDLYLDNQDIVLDFGRFRETLLKAFRHLKAT